MSETHDRTQMQACVRCGAPVSLQTALCERCNPLGLAQPAASQAHGTVFLGIGAAVLLRDVGGIRRVERDPEEDEARVEVVLLAFGGWNWVLWGIALRTTLGLHSTWLVNSATHMWGPRRFNTIDDSRNNWLVAAITFGEGWHNNHHHFPGAARQGFFWWEIDLTYYALRALAACGLVWDLKLVPATVRAARRESLPA